MDSQKADNQLNLALDATEEERRKSLELDVGYDPVDRKWELIIKYSGDLEEVRLIAESVTEMANEYAVIVIRESRISELVRIPEVEYVEKPKRLFFQVANGKRVSCINPVRQVPFSLRGKGILVAIVDSGIDYSLWDFRNPDGTTRIRALWDQSITGNPPAGYSIGTEYTQEQINEALSMVNQQERNQIVPSRDISGHGTAVAGIAAGNGRQRMSSENIRNRENGGQPGMPADEGNGNGIQAGMPEDTGTSAGISYRSDSSAVAEQYAGVAPESELLIVKMGSPRADGFPRTTELIQGVDYVIKKALELRMPVAVNISFGNTYGPHDGSSLLERFLDDISNYWKSVICVGTGNEGTSAGHTAGRMRENQEEVVQLGVQTNEPALNVQIWKSYVDQADISLVSPSGVRVGPIQEILGPQRFVLGNTEILLYYGEPSPYSVRQEIFIDFLPRQSYIDSGVWKIILTPRKIVNGEYEMWLPSQGVLNVGTAFLYPESGATLTIPSTASRVVTVGAYDALNYAYADFSGRGARTEYTAGYENVAAFKPDLAAPGVNVMTAAAGGGYAPVTGTSFATPFVTGGAALLMEWGIVRNNDPYLYGEKVKAYLRRGARELPGFEKFPNPQVGYGALCVRDSLPI
ncbi:hypothetical protein D3Z53_23935 [Lachnospiraceae bacterium]|jgi:subtilisin family serine protease|nr:S8 family peptidase [uncultured Schaedlerella sp.]NBI60986.1 hypothetical protein [Lachnospiraceae bacterium]